MWPGLNTGANQGHNSSDVKKKCNESLLYPPPYAATVPNLSMGYIGYPLWYTHYTVVISGVVVSCWFTLVSTGGLRLTNYVRKATVISRIFLNKLALVFVPCWVSFVWFLKTFEGHFPVIAVATPYIPILPSTTPVVVMVGHGVQTETHWSCILEIYSVWKRLYNESFLEVIDITAVV